MAKIDLGNVKGSPGDPSILISDNEKKSEKTWSSVKIAKELTNINEVLPKYSQSSYDGSFEYGNYMRVYGRGYVLKSNDTKTVRIIFPKSFGNFEYNAHITPQLNSSTGTFYVSDMKPDYMDVTFHGEITGYSQYFYWTVEGIVTA